MLRSMTASLISPLHREGTCELPKGACGFHQEEERAAPSNDPWLPRSLSEESVSYSDSAGSTGEAIAGSFCPPRRRRAVSRRPMAGTWLGEAASPKKGRVLARASDFPSPTNKASWPLPHLPSPPRFLL